ncbi:hypothetical protein [Tessaracoccus lacteus]|uniref:DUF3352 domain-containing protein n=1 Tax=Tessaracoccus lacteus TaxID=3041766 RepID=A0ABY8PVV1_9ACTN|nr:hypothetical protein [Tessaracoccus sp. T21]WGT46471.1 hypothetical protein QH948_09975 [Tessaracoccus sp. T21]
MTQTTQPVPAAAEAPKKSKAPVVVAVAIAAVVVVAGVVAAFTLLRGSTPTASQGLPSTVLASVEVNLNPSAGDQLALKGIADKLPDLGLGEIGDDYKAALWSLIPAEEGMPEYSEVEPWLGDSVAIGALPVDGDATDVQAVMSVQVTDQSAAQAFADEYLEGTTVFFVDDLMVVSAEATGLEQADVTSSPLASYDTFTSDMAKLSGSSLATAWVSPAGAALALQEGEDSTGITADAGDLTRDLHGAAALQVADSLLTLRTVFDAPGMAADGAGDVRDVAGNLSADSLFALATATNDDSISRIWEAVSANETATAWAQQFGLTSQDDLGALLGESLGLTLGMDEAGSPVLGAALVGDDAARQKEILDQLDTTLQQSGATGLRIEQDGDTGVIALGQEVSDVTNPASKLSSLDGWSKLVDGPAQSVLYVNVPAILADQNLAALVQQSSDLQAWLEPVSGMAVTSTQDSSTVEALVRVSFS